MAKFPVVNRCISCGSEDLDIPVKKNADTLIKCNECGNKDRWVKVVSNSLVRVRKEASIYFQENLQKFEKQQDEIIKNLKNKNKEN
ncbi:MAG: hypothetical protein ACPG8V_04460 [Alphaproteobacteria bacterium]